MLEKLLLEAAVAELETPGLHMRGAQQKPPGVLVSKKKRQSISGKSDPAPMGLCVGRALCSQKKMMFVQEQPQGLPEGKLPLSIPRLPSLCHILGCQKQSLKIL